MNKINILKYVAIAMLCAGSILIIIGVYKYMDKDNFLKKCLLIKCKVINIEEKIPGKPVYTFKDVQGTHPQFTYAEDYDTEKSKPDYTLNETYEVYFYSKDPALSEPRGFFVNHGDEFIYIIIGFAFMLDFPMMLFVISMQKKKIKNTQSAVTGNNDNMINEQNIN